MSDADHPQDEGPGDSPTVRTGHGSPGAAAADHFRLARGEACPVCGELGIGVVRHE